LTNETTKPIRTLIIDDEDLARRRIVNLLKDHQEFVIAGEAENAQEAIEILRKSKPQLVFLDISLPDLDGFSIIESLPDHEKPLIIIVSGSGAHAVKAFDYHAFDYLLKPYKDQRFFEALQEVKQKLNAVGTEDALVSASSDITQERNVVIPIKSAGKISFIEPRDIWYIEASGYYIEINASGKKHLLRQSMGRIMDRLDNTKFIRIHRSIIINLHYMNEIVRSPSRDHLIKMKDGSLFKVSKSYKKALFQKLHL